MREIDLALENNRTRIIEHFEIALILKKLGFSRINDKIAQLLKNEVLMQLKKGLYLYKPLHNHILFSKELIANRLLSPSYVSLDYALSFYNIIPERVCEVTSITIKRTKVFHTALGVFSYTHIPKALFHIGLNMQSVDNICYIIASKEKALCDKVFFTRGFEIQSKKAMRVFLEDDLRIDLEAFKNANLDIFKVYFNASKSKRIGILTRLMESLQ